MTVLGDALAEAGGAAAPAAATAQLRGLVLAALRHGREELARKRSGYDAPVEVAVGAHDGLLLAATPAAAALRADPERAAEREWLLVAATLGALVELAEPGPPADAGAIAVGAGELDQGFLVVGLPAPGLDAATVEELVALAFDEQVEPVDRLKAAARAVPGAVLADVALREPIGAGHPLRIAEAVARFGGRPADPRSVEEQEETVLTLLAPPPGPSRAPTRTPTRRGASRGGSSSGSTAWASGAATTRTSPTSRAGSPATSGRSRRRWGRRCWPTACWPRSRPWASATCSSTRAARPTSTA